MLQPTQLAGIDVILSKFFLIWSWDFGTSSGGRTNGSSMSITATSGIIRLSISARMLCFALSVRDGCSIFS